MLFPTAGVGDMLIVAVTVSGSGAIVVSIADAAGNTYSSANVRTASGQRRGRAVVRAGQHALAGQTVNVTLKDGTDASAWTIAVHDLNATDVLDATATNQVSATGTVATPPLVTTRADDFIVSLVHLDLSDDLDGSAMTPYTSLGAQSGDDGAYTVVDAPGTYTAARSGASASRAPRR